METMDRVNAIAEIAVDTQKALSSSCQNGSRLFFFIELTPISWCVIFKLNI